MGRHKAKMTKAEARAWAALARAARKVRQINDKRRRVKGVARG